MTFFDIGCSILLMNNFLTLKEFAIVCHTKPRTVRDWIKKGIVHKLQVVPRGQILISQSDVPAFIREREAK